MNIYIIYSASLLFTTVIHKFALIISDFMRRVIKRNGVSYKKRVLEVNGIFDRYARTGLSNREIWRRYIYPSYGISERTFYNLLKASADPSNEICKETQLMLNFDELNRPYESPYK